MPRGIPKSGFRKRRAGKNRTHLSALPAVEFVNPVQIPVKKESDQEIDFRIKERFSILEDLVEASTKGDCRALIVSGPAGLGKSHTIEQKLRYWDPNEINHTIIKGYVRATGLYKLLYQYREEGQIIVFDDADTIFFDDTSLNMLKAVCDTTERRRVSYLAETAFLDKNTAELIPESFDFNGTIIFITNYDFDAMIDRNHKLGPHLKALVSRSYYIDLQMKSNRDYMMRIKQVVDAGLFDGLKLSEAQQQDVMSFIEHNSESLRELSLRVAIKIGIIRKQDKNWEKIARVTTCKQ